MTGLGLKRGIPRFAAGNFDYRLILHAIVGWWMIADCQKIAVVSGKFVAVIVGFGLFCKSFRCFAVAG